MKNLLKGLLVGSIFLTLNVPKVNALKIDGVESPNAENIKLELQGNKKTLTIIGDASHDIIVEKDEEVTLVLENNATLSNKTNDTIEVKNGGTLTIQGKGTITNETNRKAVLYNNGTTTINSKDITLTREMTTNASGAHLNNYYVILNHGNMTIKNAKVIEKTPESENVSAHGSSLIANGYYSFTTGKEERSDYIEGINELQPTLVIDNGEFDGGMNTIKNDDNGKLTINDGTFKNNYQVSLLNWHIAEINGGKFYTPTGNDKTNINARATQGVDFNKGELTINGGYFEAEYTLEGKGPNKVTINGGEFNYSKAFINDSNLSDDNFKSKDGVTIDSYKFLANSGSFKTNDVGELYGLDLELKDGKYFIKNPTSTDTNNPSKPDKPSNPSTPSDSDDNKKPDEDKKPDDSNNNNNNTVNPDNNNNNNSNNNTNNNQSGIKNPQTGDSIIMYGGMITFGLGVLVFITKKLI
ncbi:MAG: carbohydrate-binding domain-containing protein [Ruminococcus sp.]|nr:carbohydrate-binding domain-containing protein [Ruminococcus sp.]